MDVTRIIQGMGKVHLRFCYRETNAAADFLAQHGTNMQPGEEEVFVESSPSLDGLVRNDLLNTKCRWVLKTCYDVITLKN